MDNFTIIVQRYWREFEKIGKKEKIIIILVLLASFLVGIFAPLIMKNLYSKPMVTLPSPTPIPIPASLSITSGSGNDSAKLGATFSATININSPNQGVDAADFVVNFDPNFLKVATVSGGNYFGLYPVKDVGRGSVKISGIANLINNKFIIPVGRGTVGTITFQTISATDSTQISFDRGKTIVASKGQNILDLNKITDLNISIK